MLIHPTLEKLNTMRFSDMAAALEEQMKMGGLDRSLVLRLAECQWIKDHKQPYHHRFHQGRQILLCLCLCEKGLERRVQCPIHPDDKTL